MKMPDVLEGSRVKLIPLVMDHAEELWESAKDESLWTHYTFRKMESFEKFKKFLAGSLEEAA
ncbi:MAG TPA: hypothetical protein VG961_01015, partial [Ignavibacteria bacterium]|nr:hypothetical protein [Ignavibacteria bacterium]